MFGLLAEHGREFPTGLRRQSLACALFDSPDDEKFFFLLRHQPAQSIVTSWDRIFQKVFATARPVIKGGHPHRFRDTFAVFFAAEWSVDRDRVKLLDTLFTPSSTPTYENTGRHVVVARCLKTTDITARDYNCSRRRTRDKTPRRLRRDRVAVRNASTCLQHITRSRGAGLSPPLLSPTAGNPSAASNRVASRMVPRASVVNALAVRISWNSAEYTWLSSVSDAPARSHCASPTMSGGASSGRFRTDAGTGSPYVAVGTEPRRGIRTRL
jgi:hypothetical protein